MSGRLDWEKDRRRGLAARARDDRQGRPAPPGGRVSKDGFFLIRARRDGVCTACGRPYKVQDRIKYRTDGTTLHVHCALPKA